MFWQKKEDNAARYFRHCHFKGGHSSTTVNQRNIPTQTADEAALQKGLLNYDTTALNNSSGLLDQGINKLNNTVNVDWNSLLNQYNTNTNSALNDYKSSNANNLSDLQGTLGSALNNYAGASSNYLNNYQGSMNSALDGYKGTANSNLADYKSSTNSALNTYDKNSADYLNEYKITSANNLGDYNKSMDSVNNGYQDLLNGNLPSTYAKARQQALNSDLTATVGDSISGLGSRGILNSSVTNNAMNNISQNASDTLAKNYSSDINTVSGLLNNQSANANTQYGNRQTTANNLFSNQATAASALYGNQTIAANNIYSNAANANSNLFSNQAAAANSLYGNQSTAANNQYANTANSANTLYGSRASAANSLYGNQTTAASNALTAAGTAEQNSYYAPLLDLSAANQLYTPAQNMYNTMYSGRMGTAGSTQSSSTNDGGASTWGAVGSIGSAMIMCFVGKTLVHTPHGSKRIIDITPGDEVYSLDDNDHICIEKVQSVLPPHMADIVDATFEGDTTIGTTESQRFYTSPWFEYVERMKKPALTFNGNKASLIKAEPAGRQDLVYDIVVSGRNIFFADGIAVEGYGD